MFKRLAKAVMPKTTWAKLSQLRTQAETARARCGPGMGAAVFLAPFLDRLSRALPGHPKWIRRLRLKGYAFPFDYRVSSSDLDVIRQVFIRREYECVAQEPDVSLIIDCGANIGCTSFFLLHRYPNARVIAVEPDPANFAMCRRNLEPFGDRVALVNSGVWPRATPLCVERGSNRDGREWTFQVRPACDGEQHHLMSTTIPDLIRSSGKDRVDLLKIDIESAEIPLFSEGTDQWLRRTRRVVIELHGPNCERVFFNAMRDGHWSFERSGELTICRSTEIVG
jgi:FkbM family methyltransferase